MIEQQLFWKDPRGILLRCLDKPEIEGVISESHEGACGGHKYWKETTYKILRAGYYWPSLFSDVYQQVRACIPCQKFVGKQKLFFFNRNRKGFILTGCAQPFITFK